MRKIMKRGLCLFLVAVLLAGLIPTAFAEEMGTNAEISETQTQPPDETVSSAEEAEPLL